MDSEQTLLKILINQKKDTENPYFYYQYDNNRNGILDIPPVTDNNTYRKERRAGRIINDRVPCIYVYNVEKPNHCFQYPCSTDRPCYGHCRNNNSSQSNSSISLYR